MADFALAMMALFLVLWIINHSNESQRQAIAGYFQDPRAFLEGSLAPSSSPIDLGGSPSVQKGQGNNGEGVEGNADAVIELDRQRIQREGDQHNRPMEDLKARLEELIFANPTISPFKDQLLVQITTEGLKIQILDDHDRPMFESGSAQLNYYFEDILWELGPLFAATELDLSVTGHTDAQRLSGVDGDDGNWLLSSMRADAARRALMESGVSKQHLAQVIGRGDTQPFDKANPAAPVNRRIEILLLDASDSKHQQEIEAPRENAWQKAIRALEQVQSKRNRPDNPYDNPPER